MREVIDDGDAVYFATNFAATANAFESCECLSNCLTTNSPGVGSNHHGQTVAHVEFAKQWRCKV